jgi:hypothetical protein
MRRLLEAFLVAGLAGLIMAVTWTRANQAPPAAPAGEKSDGKPLALADIKRMLDELGIDSTEGKNAKGEVASYSFVETGFTIQVDVSGSKNFVWCTTYLAELKDPATVPAEALLKLLNANSEMGAHFFAMVTFQGGTKGLYAYLPLLNRGIDKKLFRSQVQSMVTSLVGSRYRDLWNPTTWEQKPKPKPPPKD